MTPKEHLIAARALIADPSGWTKGAAARDANGHGDCDMDKAVCFCSVGAVWRVGVEFGGVERILGHIVRTTTNFGNIISFNDAPATTHADVVRVFDLAIAAAGEG